jgi:hypothetical protein
MNQAPPPAYQNQNAAPGASLSEAVQAAHDEGQEFGGSVARDAPALWLEAVLARKPRMPSDLEARLLQGSALPIDFLLHDEVRHALRRGFWDALERTRRLAGLIGKSPDCPRQRWVGWTTWLRCPANCLTPWRSTRRGPATTSGPRSG